MSRSLLVLPMVAAIGACSPTSGEREPTATRSSAVTVHAELPIAPTLPGDPLLGSTGVRAVWTGTHYVVFTALSRTIFATRVDTAGNPLDVPARALVSFTGNVRRFDVAMGSTAVLVAATDDSSYGAAHTVVVAPDLTVSPMYDSLRGPCNEVVTTAALGARFLVACADGYGSRIIAVRVGSDNLTLDATPLELATAPPASLHSPRIATDGTSWMLSWTESTSSGKQLASGVVGADGIVTRRGPLPWIADAYWATSSAWDPTASEYRVAIGSAIVRLSREGLFLGNPRRNERCLVESLRCDAHRRHGSDARFHADRGPGRRRDRHRGRQVLRRVPGPRGREVLPRVRLRRRRGHAPTAPRPARERAEHCVGRIAGDRRAPVLQSNHRPCDHGRWHGDRSNGRRDDRRGALRGVRWQGDARCVARTADVVGHADSRQRTRTRSDAPARSAVHDHAGSRVHRGPHIGARWSLPCDGRSVRSHVGDPSRSDPRRRRRGARRGVHVGERVRDRLLRRRRLLQRCVLRPMRSVRCRGVDRHVYARRRHTARRARALRASGWRVRQSLRWSVAERVYVRDGDGRVQSRCVRGRDRDARVDLRRRRLVPRRRARLWCFRVRADDLPHRVRCGRRLRHGPPL